MERGNVRDAVCGRARANVHRERFVQVQVADVASTRRRVRETDLCVQICAVEVHLSAVLVDDAACLQEWSAVANLKTARWNYILHTSLEHAECRWVGDLCASERGIRGSDARNSP